MTEHDGYDDAARERIVEEPPKRVDAPVRTAFERDRARVVHAAASRRLAAKTQVVGPQSDDFVRNRLTHSLEVAQVARDLSRALGSQPDIAETAALAHDLGHPPFGHNGERVLAELGASCGGFEGNAQTLRLLTRLEAKTVDADGALGRAQPDPRHARRLHEVPVAALRGRAPTASSACTSTTARSSTGCAAAPATVGSASRRRSWTSPTTSPTPSTTSRTASSRAASTSPRSSPAAVWETVRGWYLPDADDDALDAALGRPARRSDSWPSTPYDGSRRSLAALKNLTSDLIGRFCGAVQHATFAAGDGPFVRYGADLVVPEQTRLEIAVLKGIAAHYVMQADDRVALMVRQRDAAGRAGRGAGRPRPGRPGPAVRRRLARRAPTTRPGCAWCSTRSPR